jgi:hypothetical protein
MLKGFRRGIAKGLVGLVLSTGLSGDVSSAEIGDREIVPSQNVSVGRRSYEIPIDSEGIKVRDIIGKQFAIKSNGKNPGFVFNNGENLVVSNVELITNGFGNYTIGSDAVVLTGNYFEQPNLGIERLNETNIWNVEDTMDYIEMLRNNEDYVVIHVTDKLRDRRDYVEIEIKGKNVIGNVSNLGIIDELAFHKDSKLMILNGNSVLRYENGKINENKGDASTVVNELFNGSNGEKFRYMNNEGTLNLLNIKHKFPDRVSGQIAFGMRFLGKNKFRNYLFDITTRNRTAELDQGNNDNLEVLMRLYNGGLLNPGKMNSMQMASEMSRSIYKDLKEEEKLFGGPKNFADLIVDAQDVILVHLVDHAHLSGGDQDDIYFTRNLKEADYILNAISNIGTLCSGDELKFTNKGVFYNGHALSYEGNVDEKIFRSLVNGIVENPHVGKYMGLRDAARERKKANKLYNLEKEFPLIK